MIELENPPIGRRTFVFVPPRPGSNYHGLVEVERQPPRPRVHLISDHGGFSEPFLSHADGKRYDSKSRYRREIKARGYEEAGNEKGPFMNPQRPEMLSVEQDILRAEQELASMSPSEIANRADARRTEATEAKKELAACQA